MSDSPPPLLSLPDSQFGETTISAAGRDHLTNQGMSGAEVRQILQGQQEFSMTLVSAYEKLSTDLSKQIRTVALDVDLRFTLEEKPRQRRALQLNIWLSILTIAQVLMALGWLYLLWRLWPILATVAALAQKAP